MKLSNKLKLITCCLVALPLTTLTSCSTDKGTVEYLETVVSDGAISEEALMNIAALRYGSLVRIINNTEYPYELETIEYEVVSVEDTLTTDQEKAILKTYNNFVNEKLASSGKSSRVSSSEITAYYGTYNDYIIVETVYYLEEGIPDIAIDYIIGDYYLGYRGDSTYIIGWTADS